MANIPLHLVGKKVRQRTFRIDQTTSNYFTDPGNYAGLDPDPARANLQQVGERVFTAGTYHQETLHLGPNALYLVLLERA